MSDAVELKAFIDGATLSVAVTSIENKESVTVVHGKLSASGLGNKESLDISAIGLDGMGARSKSIYVDSVAHRLTDRIPVKNGTLSLDVYWVFDRELSGPQKGSLKLVIEK